MPIATTLPKSNITIRFPAPSDPGTQEESYRLLELPAEIVERVEASSGPYPLTIKGRPSDDAVLCTPDGSFLLRTVGISNSLVILRTPPSTEPTFTSSSNIASTSTSTFHSTGSSTHTGPSERDPLPTLEIRDICHEILECVPQAGQLERIRSVLRPTQWEGLGKRKREVDQGGGRRWTRAQLASVVQGSEVELQAGLKERNVVEIDGTPSPCSDSPKGWIGLMWMGSGRMVLLPPKELAPLLCLFLTLLTIHATELSSSTAPVGPIPKALEEDHDVPSDLARAVMGLFGELDGETWEADTRRMVGEVGKGLLAGLKPKGRAVDSFMSDWREQVGEAWEALVDLKLLEGDYLLNSPPPSALTHLSSTIIPFPAHTLPLHPATRFADLFLTRPRWRPDDMAPFLRGLTRDGDNKERDKLVAKFVRVVKEKEGVWWYPRRTS